MTRKLPKKKKDPGHFLIPSEIGNQKFKGLCDLGASINLMPLSIYKSLGIGQLQHTTINLIMADQSEVKPVGVMENVLVKVEHLMFPVDFVVIDSEEGDVLLLFGRPFLYTAKAVIDVYKGEFTLTMGEEKLLIRVFTNDDAKEEGEIEDDSLYAEMKKRKYEHWTEGGCLQRHWGQNMSQSRSLDCQQAVQPPHSAPSFSGKSTLLNHLFGTNFREMDAFKGRNQTTKGIWIAKCLGIEPCTIVMDLEGTDGRERGEDDTTFEKQSALFALAISDIVLINMWCHDIGREQAANKPLLKTVFQVMMRLFSPRKTTLLFVIRDKTKTPLEHLETVLREDIQKIWDAVPKPQAHKDIALSEFFNVEVTALASYEDKEKLFKEQVAQLRQRFFHSIAPGGLAGDRQGVIPASGFSFSAQQIWKVIRENKDLDLPAHKVMVATVRCEEIATEKLRLLTFDKAWLELEAAVQSGPVPEFGRKLGSILDVYLSEYDAEAVYFDEGVRTAKRQQLESKALQLVYPAFQTMLGYLRSKALEKFKIEIEQSLKNGKGFATSVRDCTKSSMLEFDRGFADVEIKQTNWDATKIREKLRRDIEAHVDSVRCAKLSKIKADYEKQLTEALAAPVESLFDTGGHDTWASIRELYKRETEKAVSGLSTSLSGFELDQVTIDSMLTELRNYAGSVVEKKAREEAGKVLIRMKERFSTVFSHDNDFMPRVWTGKEDIKAITKNSRAAALQVLSVLAAIRLDEKTDKIEHILYSTLLDSPVSKDRRTSADPLSSSTWEEVSQKDMLISPVQCKSIWRQFIAETEYTVTQAISAQEAHKRSDNWLPPPWAILAIAILGFNEFMVLLRNPLYLMLLFILYLVSKAIWVQADVTGEFGHSTLYGLLVLASRFFPTLMNILRKITGMGQMPHRRPQPRQPYPALSSQTFSCQSQRQASLSNSVPASSSSSVVSPSNSDIKHLNSTRRQIGDADQESSTS